MEISQVIYLNKQRGAPFPSWDVVIDSVRVDFTCCRWGFQRLGVMFAVSIVHQYRGACREPIRVINYSFLAVQAEEGEPSGQHV